MFAFVKSILASYCCGKSVTTSQDSSIEVVKPVEQAPSTANEEVGRLLEVLTTKLDIEKSRNKRNKGLIDFYKQEVATLSKTKVKTKTTFDGEDKTKLRNWATRVKQAGKCDCCSSTENLTAHHLYDKHTHPSIAFIDDNGVCLCKSCHEEFHRVYTSKTNCIPSMYYKFKTRKQNEVILRKQNVL